MLVLVCAGDSIASILSLAAEWKYNAADGPLHPRRAAALACADRLNSTLNLVNPKYKESSSTYPCADFSTRARGARMRRVVVLCV